MRRKPREAAPRGRFRKSRLEDLIGRALGDADGDEEQQMAFHAALEEHVRLPLRTVLADGPAVVRAIEVGPDDELVAVCWRAGERRVISLAELPLPRPAPRGAEWIEAYRRWREE
jgi:hypothetical protein